MEIAAVISVAGWFVQPIIEVVLDKAIKIGGSRLARKHGIDGNINSLQNSLQNVQIVLGLAEGRQIPKNIYEQLQSLMKELKSVAYEADDLLEEVNYDILKHNIKHGKGKEYRCAGDFSISTVASKFKKLFSSNNVKEEAADIKSRLDELAAKLREHIKLLPIANNTKEEPQVNPIRDTSSLSSEGELFGRDKEFKQVVKLLTDGSGTSDDNFSVIALYGIGGVGKTTLAQHAYNAERVKKYFEMEAWVCVSDCFDEKRITEEIIAHVTKEERSKINLNILQSTLTENIRSKKLLVVLDDVWTEDVNRWGKLCAPLRHAAPDTKILLTTRSRAVADKFGSPCKIICLKGLEEDAFWKLFEKCIFGSSNLEENANLETLGKKIARKLNGSPLAAKTIGSILRRDISIQHWTTIMESKLWELPQSDTDIFPALRLSYEYLPTQLKQCFSYCSLFPKDYEIEKEVLIYMWMSQGFILPQNNCRIEDEGSIFIDNLISSCFFENVFDDDKKIKIHDLIHDLAESVSRDENLRIDNCTSRSLGGINNLSLNLDNLKPDSVQDICNKHNKFRTLMVPYKSQWINVGLPLDDTFKSLKSIRTLALASCGIKMLPDSIQNLKYLRYLDISRNDIETLPDTLCSLYNLQYLNISHLPLKCFPTRMCDLINLKCIKSHSYYEHDSFMCPINEVGKMTSLQFLPDFKVSHKKGRTISEVKSLRQLHGSFCLWSLEVVESGKAASEAKLNEKKFLDELALLWDSNPRSYENDLEVIEGLQPHKNIKRLSIKSYGGSLTPSWLNHFVWYRINKLKISECHNLEKIECLGQLPYLKFLDIRDMNAVKIVSHGLCSEFKNMEEIRFDGMPEWENWIMPEGNYSFPCLRKLTVFDCPKLNAIPLLKEVEVNSNDMTLFPVGLTSLQKLYTAGCPNLKPMGQNKDAIFLPPSITELWLRDCGYVEKALQGGCLQRLTSLTELSICAHETKSNETPVALFLPPSITELLFVCLADDCGPSIRSVHGLTSCPHLYRLAIHGCSGIDSLPLDLLCNLTGLEHLSIRSCRGLASIEGLQAVTSLKQLWIQECPKLTKSETSITKTVADVGEAGLSSSPSLMLEQLWIDDPRLLKLPTLQTSLRSLRTLMIFECEESVILNDDEDRELLLTLKSLVGLHFFKCLNLKSLPSGLPSLVYLHVDECPNLQSVPVERFPPSLKWIDVSIEHCDGNLKEQLQKYKQEKHKKGEQFDLYFI